MSNTTTPALFSQGPIDGLMEVLYGEPQTYSVFTPNFGEGALAPKAVEHVYDRTEIKCGDLIIYTYRK